MRTDGTRGVVAIIEVEWTIPRSHIDKIICCKLRQPQVLTLGLGVPFDIWCQEILKRLNHPVRLSIYLRMKHSTEPKICTEQVKQCRPEIAGESWISVRYNYFKETV